MSIQTFNNGETGLSIRNKLNSVIEWNPSFIYNINGITHVSGTLYYSNIDNNVGIFPISSSFWGTTTQTQSSSLNSTFSVSSSYASSSTNLGLTVYNISVLQSSQSKWATSSSFASSSLSSSYITGSITFSSNTVYQLTSSVSILSLTSSYISQSNIKIESGSLYLLSNSGSWWKIKVVEDANHLGSLGVDGPF